MLAQDSRCGAIIVLAAHEHYFDGSKRRVLLVKPPNGVPSGTRLVAAANIYQAVPLHARRCPDQLVVSRYASDDRITRCGHGIGSAWFSRERGRSVSAASADQARMCQNVISARGLRSTGSIKIMKASQDRATRVKVSGYSVIECRAQRVVIGGRTVAARLVVKAQPSRLSVIAESENASGTRESTAPRTANGSAVCRESPGGRDVIRLPAERGVLGISNAGRRGRPRTIVGVARSRPKLVAEAPGTAAWEAGTFSRGRAARQPEIN